MAAPSDDESSGGEIPFKKSSRADDQLKKDLDSATIDDDDEEEMSEDEYIVEKILGHKFAKKGALIFQVKWQGYSEKESTWEPEEHLEGCPDELDAYYKEIGGKPIFGKKGATASPLPPAKKRKLSQNASATNTPTPPPSNSNKKGGRPRKEDKAPTTTLKKSQEQIDQETGYPAGSWEDKILNIDTITRDNDGNLHIWLVWKNNQRTTHPAAVAYARCPQKCLQFYEAHLHFNIAQRRPSPRPEHVTVKSSSGEKTDERSEAEDEDEVMNVKRVATTT